MANPYQMDKVYCAKMAQKWRFIQQHHPARVEQAEAAIVQLQSAIKVVPVNAKGPGTPNNG